MSFRISGIGLIALAAALLAPLHATAQCVYGDGEAIAHVADLPAGALAQKGVPDDYVLGYKYQYVHIFWLPVWTSGGQYVLYKGDRYYPLEADADKAAATSGASRNQVQVPLEYAVPTGWMVFGPLLLVAALWLLVATIRSGRQYRAGNALLADPRYATAINTVAQGGEAALPQAVSQLVSQGVPEEKARRVLQAFLAVYLPKPAAAEEKPAETGPDDAPPDA